MNFAGKLFVGIALLSVAGVVACKVAYPIIHVRYRLTVEVKVDDQIKSGSGVIDVTYPIYPDDLVFLGGPESHKRVVGYAITVDLGDRGLLFLTFKDAEQRRTQTIQCPLSDIACLPFAAYEDGQVIGGAYSEQKASLRTLQSESGPRDVPFSDLPELVRFLDINDPKSLVPVAPFDLAKSFGPNVQLSRVVLELTDSPITPMPSNWPQWLSAAHQKYTIFRGYDG